MNKLAKLLLGASAGAMLGATAQAQTTAPAPAPAATAPAPAPVPMPSMAGPLAANPAPMSVNLDVPGLQDFLGKVYITGAVTGMVMTQTNALHVPGDRDGYFDLTNGQIALQKTDGWFQWYVQAGAYSTPTLGTPYTNSSTLPAATFGSVPQGWVKLVANDNLNVIAGELPTLIGDEYFFTYENMNIERGLLWAQEPVVSRGVQVNLTEGPLTASLSLNDGFYSDRFNELSGLLSYAFNGGADTLALVGTGNTGHTSYGNAGSTLFQNNAYILNAIYTHTSGPWTISPYFQYSASSTAGPLGHTSSTAGAILASYAINDYWKLAGRFEYVGTSGPVNILYGPGSNAFSFTVTPTWQYKLFFIRPEVSYVSASSVTSGSGIGPSGKDTDQFRALLETGILF